MPDESGSLVQLAGSERASLPDVTDTAPLNTQDRAEITVVLRRRAELPAEIVEGPTVLSHAELGAGYGADPADVDLVSRELTSRGLEVTAVHPATRRVKVAGSLGDLSGAFGTTLRQVSSPDPGGHGRVTHRYREGPLYVPAALAGVVTAVLGLDTRPQAQPHFRTPRDAAAAQGTSYYPNQVAQIYDFPANTTGAGQTVAVIELGGGFTTSDLDAYFGGLNIAVPSITAVGVDGASNNPGDTSGASVEVNLDIDVIGAAAPGAAQIVYFAPNNGDQGFVDAISARGGRYPDADRDLDQLGAVRRLVDRAGAVGDERGDVRRGGDGHHGVRGRRRQWVFRWGHPTGRCTSTSPPPAPTRWAAAGPSWWPTRPPGR